MAKLRIESQFGIAPNDLLNNESISLKAKGLYTYIQAKPEDWDFSAERIAKESKDGVDGVKAGLQELEKFGYLVRNRYQSGKGFWETEYVLYTNPKVGNPVVENPTLDNPTQENPTWENPPIIKNNTNKTIINKTIDTKEENQQKAETLETNLDEEYFSEPLETPEEKKEKSCAKKEKEIFEYYNANRNQMQEAEILSDQRKQSIRVRLKDYGEEKVKQMIDKASKSDFLNGLVEGRDFKAGFDWIFKPSNFVKILEGNYDNKLQKQDGNTKNRIRNR
ncbi:hypothetical protein CMV04_12445 [Elizabethkingia anophelis]|nr:hypothetical protein [Elizabethkingia anophelis]